MLWPVWPTGMVSANLWYPLHLFFVGGGSSWSSDKGRLLVLAFIGCSQFSKLLVSGCNQLLKVAALGQAGILGKFLTSHQLENWKASGPQLQLFLVLERPKQIFRNGDGLLFIVLHLDPCGNLDHGCGCCLGTMRAFESMSNI